MNKKRLPDDRFKKKRKVIQKPNTHRLFLSIEPSIEFKNYVRDTTKFLDKQKRNLRMIPIEQLNILVKFIGPEVSNSSLEILIEELNKLSSKLPKPEIKALSYQLGFPYQKDPTVLLMEIDPNNDLIDLSETIHSLLKFLGLDDTVRWKVKNTNSYHLTVGKIKANSSKSISREVSKLVDTIDIDLPVPFTPDSIVLMESVSDGVNSFSYRPILRIKL